MSQVNGNVLNASLTELSQAADLVERLQKLTAQYPNFRAGITKKASDDPQKGSVYKAEALHSKWNSGKFGSFEEVIEFVNHVISSKWYTSRFGSRPISISAGGNDEVAACGGLFHISIPPAFRRRMVVLHEIAHAVSWQPGSRAEDHGPSFCALYIELVAQFLGIAAADELRDIFKARGIRVSRNRRFRPIKSGRRIVMQFA